MVIYMYYINTFLIYSILGYGLETVVAFFTKSHFQSGILYGPWTPVYGVGAVMIVLLSNYLFYNLHMPRIYETLFAFVIITIMLTAIEWLGGIAIEHFFHKVFWDYSSHPFHIGKYISLTMSLTWGIGSIFFIYVIKPFLDPLVKQIPLTITIIVMFVFLLDYGLTFYHNIK